ncbi:hypothetical protein AJ79_03735 [Helicocarpus griseus UAMH5409]|uniref:Uncharacterized protein n=1 Tax=Helicocarpus griseus UAMH5409 TaxID=1447875 RepID=A0A2B7XWJ9_9EURO|nr:hypothetical protein AJ79_03735 [Helicocarpus griseus UAMH5409]
MSFSLPLRLPLPRPSTLLILLGTLPLTAPTAYLLYLRLTTAPHVTSRTGRYRHRKSTKTSSSSTSSSTESDAEPPSPTPPLSIPSLLPASPSHTIMYERVTSHPLPLSSLKYHDGQEFSNLLTAYLRTTMKAFARTPQARMIRKALEDGRNYDGGGVTVSGKGDVTEVADSFEDRCIDEMRFGIGERVNGVYVVGYRGVGPAGGEEVGGGERVELRLQVPEGYKGPGAAVEGIIVAGVEGVEGDVGSEGERRVVMVNETWLWRAEGEKKVLLEGVIGKWLHGLLAGWLVVKGMGAVMV